MRERPATFREKRDLVNCEVCLIHPVVPLFIVVEMVNTFPFKIKTFNK